MADADSEFSLTSAQREMLRAAKSWWEEGERALDYRADTERQTATAARLRPLFAALRTARKLDAAHIAPILQKARTLAANRAMTRLLETAAFAVALQRLLDDAAALPQRLAVFLQTPGVGPQTAAHLLYAAAPDRFPLVSPATLAVLAPTRSQRKAARDLARQRYAATIETEETPAEVLSLLSDFVLYEAARRELALNDFIELNAVLWRAKEMPKGGDRQVSKTSFRGATGNKGKRQIREEKAVYAPTADAPEPTESDLLAWIEGYVAAQGFTFPPLIVRDYYIALKAKPFVILTGLSGTGKTRLTRLFADALTGETGSAGGQYLLLPVRPDWTDSAPLLGYHNLLTDRYIGTPFLDILRRAAAPENRDRVFFVCLDEMNLARVEHYFAEMLSAMETPEPRQISLSDGRLISLPSNIFLTGSANMDEATHAFSRKALDRANLIEFTQVRLMPDTASSADLRPATCDLPLLDRQRLFLANRVETLTAARERLAAADSTFADRSIALLSHLNDRLEPRGLHFGYRVRDEVLRYCAAAFSASGVGLLSADAAQNLALALDLQIVQKALPRLSGTAEALERLLREIEQWAIAENLPRTAAKLSRMRSRAAEDGIVTFYEM